MRRVSLTNHGRRARSLELTSYAEVVLAPHAADLAHPAFSNLFVETGRAGARRADLRRGGRAPASDRPYLVHVLSGRGRSARRRSTKPIARASSAAAATLDRRWR